MGGWEGARRLSSVLMSDRSGEQIVIPKVRERLSLSKQMHKFHMEWFSPKKLKEVEGREEYCIEI
jgi:hypothetical protein